MITCLIKVVLICPILIIIFTTTINSQSIADSLKPDTLANISSKKFVLEKILIQGNKHTENEVILREMHIKEGMLFSINELEEEQTRIYNLGLFTKVEFMPLPSGGNSMSLLITVEEMYYILPIPIGGFRGGDIKKFWAGIDFRYRNFRGMNETLGLGFALGYEPFISMSYFNPWVGKNSHLFLSGNLRYGISKNNSSLDTNSNLNLFEEGKVNEFDIENISASSSIGKYFTSKLSSSFGIGFNYVKPSQILQNTTLNPGGIDKFLSLIFEFSYDNRNLYEYTTYGSYLKVDYIRYGVFSEYFDFNKIRSDLRTYLLINPFNLYEFTLGTRLFSTFSFGNKMPSYLKEIIGSYDYLRGWKNFIAEGDNKLMMINELRFPVIKPAYVPGKNIPVIKGISYLNRFSYKYGLYWTLFHDIGGVWNKNDNLFKTRFYQSIGTGLNIIMPFSFVSRIELAYRFFDNKLIPQININLNNSF